MLKIQLTRISSIGKIVNGVMCVLSLGCSQTPISEECSFEYSDIVKQKIVSPILKDEFGELLLHFDVESPAIVSSNGTTKLIVAPINRVNGMMTMREDSYVFVFDSCTNELVEHYKVIMN